MSEVGKTRGTKPRRGVVVDMASKRGSAGEGKAPPADEVAAKKRARELARAQATVEAANETRSGRVEELKRQVERGEYHPDPREVAREILKHGL